MNLQYSATYKNITCNITGTTVQTAELIVPKNTGVFIESKRIISSTSCTSGKTDWAAEVKSMPTASRQKEMPKTRQWAANISRTISALQSGEDPLFTFEKSNTNGSSITVDSHVVGQLLVITPADGKIIFRQGALLLCAYEEGATIAMKQTVVTGKPELGEADAFRAEHLGMRYECRIIGEAIVVLEIQGDWRKIELDSENPKKMGIRVDPRKFVARSSNVKLVSFPNSASDQATRTNIGRNRDLYLEAKPGTGKGIVYLASQVQEDHNSSQED